MKKIILLCLLFVTTMSGILAQTRPDNADIRYGESTSVHTFGAVGDGVTDDTAAFLKAIKNADRPGRIHLTTGKTYLISYLQLSGDPLSANYIGVDSLCIEGNGAKIKSTSTDYSSTSLGVDYGYRASTFNLNKIKAVIKNISVEGTFLSAFQETNTPPSGAGKQIGQFSVIAGSDLDGSSFENITASKIPILLNIYNSSGLSAKNSKISECYTGVLIDTVDNSLLENISVSDARFTTLATGGEMWGVATITAPAPYSADLIRSEGYGFIIAGGSGTTLLNCVADRTYADAFRTQNSGSGAPNNGIKLIGCQATLYRRHGFSTYGNSNDLQLLNCSAWDYDRGTGQRYCDFWNGEPPDTLAELQSAATYANYYTAWNTKNPARCIAYLIKQDATVSNCSSYGYNTKYVGVSPGDSLRVVNYHSSLKAIGAETHVQCIDNAGNIKFANCKFIGPVDRGIGTLGLVNVINGTNYTFDACLVDVATTTLAGDDQIGISVTGAANPITFNHSKVRRAAYSIFLDNVAPTISFNSCDFLDSRLQQIFVSGANMARNVRFKNCSFLPTTGVTLRINVAGAGKLYFENCSFNKKTFLNADSAAADLTRVFVHEGADQVMWTNYAASGTWDYWGVEGFNIIPSGYFYDGSDYTPAVNSLDLNLKAFNTTGPATLATLTQLISSGTPYYLKANIASGGTGLSQLYLLPPAQFDSWWYIFLRRP